VGEEFDRCYHAACDRADSSASKSYPGRTTFPIIRPDSIIRCASRRLAAESRSNVVVSVVWIRPRVDQPRHLVQDLAVDGALRLEERAREHQLPVPREALVLQREQVHARRLVDGDDLAARGEQLGVGLDVRTGYR
jgi:hypothetical protein